MPGDWVNWQDFYAANQPEAERQGQEEADKYSQSSRSLESALQGYMQGRTSEAQLGEMQAAQPAARRTGISTPWENAVYGSGDGAAKLDYGDAWGSLGSRLAGIQAQQQKHEVAMAHAPKPAPKVAPTPEPLDPNAEWYRTHPWERNPKESYAEYSDRQLKKGPR